MFDISELSSLPLFNNSIVAWTSALGVTVAVLALFLLARRIVRRYHRKFVETSARPLLRFPFEVLSKTAFLFFLIVALFAGTQMLTLGEGISRTVNSVITIALFWQAGIWAVATTTAWFDYKRRGSMQTDRAAVTSIGIIGVIVNVAIWSFVVLLTLDNLGVDITALVAGLGIGGIAVALAVQNIFGDLFASLSITLDRPFVVGDFLIVDDFLGSVESIGIKSTRLRSLSGEQIVMANSDLLGSRVRNYGRMMERRVVFPTRVTYETPIEVLEKLPGTIREIVEAQPNTRFDRSHFAAHGLGSLDFETVYYVLSPDYTRYMDTQQAINLSLRREFAKLGIEFAYPTQKLLLERFSERAA